MNGSMTGLRMGVALGALATAMPALAQTTTDEQARTDEARPVAAQSSAAPATGEVDPDSSDAAVIVVSGSRLSDTIATFPGSASVLTEATIEGQLAVTRDLANILSFSVPGLAQGNNSAANVEQSLRGRPVRIFIDGIPISNPLRDGGRDVRLIAPTALASIEVIRGASALYGQGGAGGVINYITKTGSRDDEWRFRTEMGTGFSLTHFEDSARPFIFQSASGGLGPFDVNVNGSYERVNSLFDADGERLPPDPHGFGGIAESDIFNLFGKVGYSFGEQRLELMANYYKQHQESDYLLVPGSIALGTPTSAVRGSADPRALDPVNRNLISYLSYTHDDLILGAFHTQLYYVENSAVFSFEPARLGGTQTTIDSEKIGLQTDFRTRLDGLGFEKGLLLWGVDVARDRTEQPLIPLTAIDGRTFTPPLKQMNYAVFAQLDLPLTDWFSLRAGIRHDEFRLTVDDFVAGLTGVRVSGGKLEYSATPINIGGTIDISDDIQIFGGFSQGFSIPDIGSPLRNAQFTTIEALKPGAALANTYEAGVRANFGAVRGTAAYYISTSKFGTDFVINPNNSSEALLILEEERIHGFEATLDGNFGDSTRWGAVFSWSEGKRDADDDGELDTPLTNRRIPAEQFNAFIEHDLMEDWMVRLQAAYTGDRNKFPGSPIGTFYTGRVEPTTRVDASTNFRVGPAEVTLGVSNLLNNDYFSSTSQLINRNERYSKAEGRMAYLQIGVDY